MSAGEPLPCPFCGNEVKSQSFWWHGCAPGNGPRGYYVFCLECSETDALDGPRRDTFEDAIAAWNRRTPPAMSADHIGEAQGWRDIATAPRDGREFQAWWKGQWQPRARFDPEFGSFQLWGRTDYDTEGWETFAIDGHWQPLPSPPSAHHAPIKPSGEGVKP